MKPESNGKPGRIVARLQDLRFADRTIRLAGGLEGSGMGMASIPAGLTVRGYVDEDVMPDRAPVVAAAAREVVVRPAPREVVVADKTVVVPHGPAARPVVEPILVKRDPALTVIAKGTPQGSPALVALAPSTAVEASTPKAVAVTTTRKVVKVVRTVRKADGVVDQGGVVTRYTY